MPPEGCFRHSKHLQSILLLTDHNRIDPAQYSVTPTTLERALDGHSSQRLIVFSSPENALPRGGELL